MNKSLKETKKLIKEIKKELKHLHLDKGVRVIIAPPFVNLQKASKLLKDSKIKVAAQNMHQSESGAFTGEVSAAMLKDIYVDTVILGHSERREYFGENDEILKAKVDTALKNKMKIIFCFGEVLEERKKGEHCFNEIKNMISFAPTWVFSGRPTAIYISEPRSSFLGRDDDVRPDRGSSPRTASLMSAM